MSGWESGVIAGSLVMIIIWLAVFVGYVGEIVIQLKRLADQFEAPKMFGEKK